jgi:hypothetical protein
MSEIRLNKPLSDVDIVLRLAIVGLTLGTAYIHLTLGGMLFTLTAFGFGVFAVALVIPIALAERFRWLLRLGLIAYTVSVIGGWVLDGARYDVAYLTKAIEGALVGLLAIDFVRRDGNPLERLGELIRPRTTRPPGPASGQA